MINTKSIFWIKSELYSALTRHIPFHDHSYFRKIFSLVLKKKKKETMLRIKFPQPQGSALSGALPCSSWQIRRPRCITDENKLRYACFISFPRRIEELTHNYRAKWELQTWTIPCRYGKKTSYPCASFQLPACEGPPGWAHRPILVIFIAFWESCRCGSQSKVHT